MPKVSLTFYLAGVVLLLVGMALGTYMGATEDFVLAPAHAHLNLLGFVANSLMGTFYALDAGRSEKLAWANFWVFNLAVAVMIPSLALFLLDPQAPLPGLGLMISPLVAIVGVALFLASIARAWKTKAA